MPNNQNAAITGNHLDHFGLQIEACDEAELLAYRQSRGVDCGKFQERCGAQGMGRSLEIRDIDGNTIDSYQAQ